MSGIHIPSYTHRKQHFMRCIRNQHFENIKQKQRMTLSNNINPQAEVYRLKDQLIHYNVQYFQP